jgi:spermidine synthase
MAKVFKERLHKGYAQTLEIAGKPLVEEKSRYQRIKIFDTVNNGRVMTLDDIVQITTRDESAYAEMLTHLPLFEHGAAARVMIVGGGDLSIADEALKHKSVKEVVLVEIDERVIELCREHFAEINAKAFSNKRLKIEVADAFEYLGRPKSKGRFDLIVADRPDPVGPGKALFGETFYDRVKAALAPGGFATFQTGVPFYQPWEITDALKELAEFFPHSGLYLSVVPTYIGGFMALTWAGTRKRLGTPAGIARARKAFARSKIKTDYYNSDIHAASFALPEWIRRLVP